MASLDANENHRWQQKDRDLKCNIKCNLESTIEGKHSCLVQTPANNITTEKTDTVLSVTVENI